MRCTLILVAFAVLVVAGCGAPPSSSPTSKGAPKAKSPPPPPPIPTATKSTAPDVVREKAVVGSGAKGRDYGTGPVATPMTVYARFPQTMAFKILIPKAMNDFRTLNGHFPKSHDEFMQKIIKDNAIKLPELPAGETYFYDAKKAATMRTYDPADPPLMVQRPG